MDKDIFERRDLFIQPYLSFKVYYQITDQVYPGVICNFNHLLERQTPVIAEINNLLERK